MNLVVLVEGEKTETLVYEAWLQQRLPALRRVLNVADLTTDGYVLAEGKEGTRLGVTNPALDVRILVQHCCIETWLLGHDGFARAATQSPDIVKFKRFFDVSTGDPEEMTRGLGYPTRQKLHLKYLQAMLAEHGRPYSKKNPDVVCHPSYFDALHKRCARTGHLSSFQKLLDAFREAGAGGS